MRNTKFSDRLIKDDASAYLKQLSAEERRPLLKQNRLPVGPKPYNAQQRELVFKILVDHSEAASK